MDIEKIEKGARVRLHGINGAFTIKDVFVAEGVVALSSDEDGKEFYALVEDVLEEHAEANKQTTGPKLPPLPISKGVVARLISLATPELPAEWAVRAEESDTIVQIGIMSVLASWVAIRPKVTHDVGPRAANSIAEALVKASIEARWMRKD